MQFSASRYLGLLQALPCLYQQGQILFCRQAANVKQYQILLRRLPFLAQCGFAMGRMKLLAVDPAPQLRQVAHARTQQRPLLAGAGGERQQGVVMKPAQVTHHRLVKKAQAVMITILLEIGVKAADNRDAQAPSHAQRGPTQRALGSQVDGVGSLFAPQASQSAGCRQAPLQLRVARDRHTAHAQLTEGAKAVRSQGFTSLGRANQLQRVVPLQQALDKMTQGVGNAIDLWREGFGNQRKAPVCSSRYRHAAIVMLHW